MKTNKITPPCDVPFPLETMQVTLIAHCAKFFKLVTAVVFE